jgi:hypothetical protein
MSESTNNTNPHFMQKVLDNNWLMLALAVLTPMVFYTLWGLWDVINIPLAP